MEETRTIGIDVGATKIVAGVVGSDGRVVDPDSRRLTPGSHSAGLVGQLAGTIADLRRRNPDVAAIGVGAAGLVHWPSGTLGYAANHTHRHLNLRSRLEDAVGLPVVVDNDANAAAWGEAQARSNEPVLFLAVGTGLGSGFVADGQVMRGPGGRGAELGHVIVDPRGPDCQCGMRGCLETLVSGHAFQEWGKTHVHVNPHGKLAQRAALRGAVVNTRMMIDVALAGDPLVVERVQEMGRDLGRAVARNAMSIYPADRVVVGGGLSALGDMLLQPMRDACRSVMARSKFLRTPRFSPATYGSDAILVGAGLLARTILPANEFTVPTENVASVDPGTTLPDPDRPYLPEPAVATPKTAAAAAAT